jgi:hypothetical protein
MFDTNNRRFAGMAGIAFVVLYLVALIAFIPSGLPNSGDPASKVLTYAHVHRSDLLTSAFLQSLAVIPWIAFVSGVVVMMRRSEGETGMWSMMAAIGGALAAAMALVACALGAMLVYRSAAGDGGLARTLLDGNAIVFAMGGLPLAVFVLAASGGLARAGAVGRWMSPVGMLVALIEVVGAAAYARGDGFFSPQGTYSYIAGFAFALWALACGVELMREHAPVAAAHPPTAAAPA